jgi:hypothetical protein
MFEPSWECHCAEPAVEAASRASGRDIWAELGGCPRSWREAAALYRRLEVRCLADAVTKVLGAPVDPKLARRGDVVMRGWSLGICRGDLAEFPNLMLPMRQVERAWHCG